MRKNTTRRAANRSDSLPARRRNQPTESPSAGAQLFRRNSTITGSASSKVRGIGELKAHLKSDRVEAHQLVRMRRHLGAILGVSLLIALCLLGLIFEFTANSDTSLVGINKPVKTASYDATINEYLRQHPLERFRFGLDQVAFTDYVQQSHPEIAELETVKNNGFGKSLFEFSVRRPVAVWTIDEERFYVDTAGKSFTVNHYSNPSINVVDESGVPLKSGVSIASNRFLGYVGRTIAGFEVHKMSVKKIIIPPNTTRQIEVRLKGQAYPIKLSIDRMVGEQVEDAVRAVSYLDSQDRVPDYVDVRVAGKAFYK